MVLVTRQPHTLQPLQAADHQPADLRVGSDGLFRAEIDDPSVISAHSNPGIEPSPALRLHLPLQRGPHLVLRLRAELERNQIFGTGAQAAADVIAGDDEVAAVVGDAAHQQVDVRVVGIPVIDRDPVEPRAEIAFHPRGQVARERPEIGHVAGVLGRNDEPEMMAVVLAAICEGDVVGAIAGGVEHLHV